METQQEGKQKQQQQQQSSRAHGQDRQQQEQQAEEGESKGEGGGEEEQQDDADVQSSSQQKGGGEGKESQQQVRGSGGGRQGPCWEGGGGSLREAMPACSPAGTACLPTRLLLHAIALAVSLCEYPRSSCLSPTFPRHHHCPPPFQEFDVDLDEVEGAEGDKQRDPKDGGRSTDQVGGGAGWMDGWLTDWLAGRSGPLRAGAAIPHSQRPVLPLPCACAGSLLSGISPLPFLTPSLRLRWSRSCWMGSSSSGSQ